MERKKILILSLFLLQGCSSISENIPSNSLNLYYKCNKDDKNFALKQSFILSPSDNERKLEIIRDGFKINDCHEISSNQYKDLLETSI